MSFLNIKYSIWLFYYHGVNLNTFITVINLLFGRGEFINVKLKKYPYSIKLRRKGSDLAVFDDVILRSVYLFETLLKFEPQIIIDCGANIGLASLFFKQMYPEAQIIAIEPEENNFKFMLENFRYYSNIHTLHSGVWSRETYISINNPNANFYGFSFHESDEDISDSVKAYSIEGIMKKYNLDNIDILKIDIESAEKEIFEADCDYWLSRTRVVIVELHDRMREGCSVAFFKTLSKYNFTTEIKGENIFCFLK